MNLTNRPITPKGSKRKRSNKPTEAQRERWERIRSLGCIVCGVMAEIHHCFTGAGGRKNHDKVIPLCHYHHRGGAGIHSIGRKTWQELFGKEQELIEVVEKMEAKII